MESSGKGGKGKAKEEKVGGSGKMDSLSRLEKMIRVVNCAVNLLSASVHPRDHSAVFFLSKKIILIYKNLLIILNNISINYSGFINILYI